MYRFFWDLVYILMYNKDAFLMQEYSYFYKICKINLFHYLNLRWFKGDLKVA